MGSVRVRREAQKLSVVPPTLRGVCAAVLTIGSLVLCFIGFLPGAMVKLVVPHAGFRRSCTRYMLFFCRAWLRVLEWAADSISGQRVVVESSLRADLEGRYLLIGNHQCWADIPVLVRALRGVLPFPRWFMKRQLLWVPIIGFATWALDFPFMKRYSGKQIAANPALAGRDLETARHACAIYRHQPVTVVNYAEGTRSTRAKRRARRSPYQTMLRPKAGGTAFMLEAMGDVLDAVVELIIAYRGLDEPTIWDYWCGRIPEIRVRLRPLDVPAELRHGDYRGDPEYAERFRHWLNAVWAERDREVVAMMHPDPPMEAR